MAAMAATDAGKAQKVADDLKAMSTDSPAAKAAKIIGWKEAADYASVTDCLKAIKYGVFAGE